MCLFTRSVGFWLSRQKCVFFFWFGGSVFQQTCIALRDSEAFGSVAFLCFLDGTARFMDAAQDRIMYTICFSFWTRYPNDFG